MNLMDRKSLKNLFRKGSFPQQANFEALIDSSVNIVDDGLNKDVEDGLKLSPMGSSPKLISFYENIEKKTPAWFVALNPDTHSKGIGIAEGPSSPSRLFLQEGGNIGINTTTPRHTLDVNGMIGMKGRLGAYAAGRVDADGDWQNILQELEGNHAFEIMASAIRVGKDEKTGETARLRRALLHAIAVSSYGRISWDPFFGGSISKTQSYRGYLNRIRIRWKRKGKGPDRHKYSLQIKTARNYGKTEDGKQIQIAYRITQLWDPQDEWRL